MRMQSKAILVSLLLPLAAWSQKWEAGGFGGFGVTTNTNITAPSASASAGLKPGLIVGGLLGSNDYRHLGGEFRYSYRFSDLKLKNGGEEPSFGGRTQFIDFRMLYHFSESGSPVRPYFAVGGGVAVYSGTGVESSQQPLNEVAALTRTRDIKPMLVGAAGVKVRMSAHLELRLEVADQVTPFPEKVITPVPGASAGGWLHNFAPMVGIVATF